MDELLLGVDVGSSSVKVCAYDGNGRLQGRSDRSLRMRHPRCAWAEMDAEHIWREVVFAVRATVSELSGKVVSIGVSSACPTTVFLDADGRPVHPAILYLDHRSMDVARDFSEKHGAAEHFALAGNRAGCSTSWMCNLVWLRDHEPELWRKVRRVTLLGGFLCMRMTGRPVIDWTQASYSGAFHVADPNAGWSDELLARWEVDKDVLAEVGPSCLPAGTLQKEAAREMGIDPGAVVAFGAADTAASAFALGMRSSDDVFESAGTSGVVTFCLDKPDFDGAFMNRCHIFPERWLAHGAMSTLGGAFFWLRENVWPDLKSMREVELLAAGSLPGAGGLLFLPYLAGERSPIWDPKASGAWLGLRMDVGRNDMARAVFEGTAFGLKQIFERGKSLWGCRPSRLVGVGGGARSRLWTEIKSEILDVEYFRADDPDAAAWGAALVGGVAAGVFSGADDPSIKFIAAQPTSKAFTESDAPSMENCSLSKQERRERYAGAFAAYEAAYPALKDVMHLLAGGARRAKKTLNAPTRRVVTPPYVCM